MIEDGRVFVAALAGPKENSPCRFWVTGAVHSVQAKAVGQCLVILRFTVVV